MLSRREWVKRFVLGSAVALNGEAWRGAVLADISPAANPANVLSFKLSDFPVLQSDYGSMRFNLFGALIPNGIITITRAPGDVFYAMSAYCTHQGQIVEAYDNSPGTEAMLCYGHGSVYDIQGRVLSYVDDPLQPNLPAYNTSLSAGVLKVEIPGLNLNVNSLSLFSVNGSSHRFQFSFPAKNGASYRLRYTSDLGAPSSIVSFATTSNGVANTTTINQTTNGTRNVWVDSPAVRGFYFVEMVVAEFIPM